MKVEEEACLGKDGRQKAKDHENEQLKVEEGVSLALEARWRMENENIGLNSEEEQCTQMKSE